METVCLVVKFHADQYIEVGLKMGEIDLTQSESRVTYAQIRRYVFDKTEIKVSQ